MLFYVNYTVRSILPLSGGHLVSFLIYSFTDFRSEYTFHYKNSKEVSRQR